MCLCVCGEREKGGGYIREPSIRRRRRRPFSTSTSTSEARAAEGLDCTQKELCVVIVPSSSSPFFSCMLLCASLSLSIQSRGVCSCVRAPYWIAPPPPFLFIRLRAWLYSNIYERVYVLVCVVCCCVEWPLLPPLCRNSISFVAEAEPTLKVFAVCS